MSVEPAARVRAFISYSWSTPAHEDWVLSLATRLREDGIDAILDKWELQPGRDPIVFMEQMVTRPDVTKVLMICDRLYKEKADGREGGVGKETQILTAQIYDKASEDKFAALITEKDADGKAFTPAYYHSRQYIDFSDPVRHEERYQELLRWLYNWPQHKKPAIGSTPSFINEPESFSTATTSKMKQAEQFIKADLPQAGGSIADFSDSLLDELVGLRPDTASDGQWDQIVIDSAEKMRPALRNLVQLVAAEARYAGKNFARFIKLFERMGSLMYRPPEVMAWSETDYDSYRVICYEGFLSLSAVLIEEGRFDLLGMALSHPYLIDWRPKGDGPATVTYRVFCQDIESFRRRKDRLNVKRLDLFADLLAETYLSSYPDLTSLNQADLVLFLRGQVVQDSNGWENWWPTTFANKGRSGVAELFARSESVSFFNSWAPKVFGPITVDEFKDRVAKLDQEFRGSWGGLMGPSIYNLANIKNLGSRP
ncbi:hypothetical protein GCM10022253_23770 [Sphingomonas endophytica]|uniref:SEFIR domain-containing protein n=1 Tax=Sphingomonas endophytica TaxID=869719 RepID=A0ABR6N2L2_9SPHN|nr:toll/interleukin-1 receptor domain-containing protein [Sphingomonas endophytica]MBB5725025.1 hypothetical protein [Sphingomonas endophytica]